MDDEADAIRSVLDGDREAFRPLVDRHQRAVVAFVRGMVGQRGDADDLSQDVFLTAYRKLNLYDAKRGIWRTWLLAIARRLTVSWIRKHRHSVDSAHVAVSPERHDPATIAMQLEWSARLDEALIALPEEQRAAFVLSEINGLPLLEIAAIEGVPVGTVKSRTSRAKESLRRAMKDYQWSTDDAMDGGR